MKYSKQFKIINLWLCANYNDYRYIILIVETISLFFINPGNREPTLLVHNNQPQSEQQQQQNFQEDEELQQHNEALDRLERDCDEEYDSSESTANKSQSESENEAGNTSGYESKGSKTTPNKQANPAKRTRQARDVLNKRANPGRVGSRRYNRWLNDVLLGRDPRAAFDIGVDDDFNEFFNDRKALFTEIQENEAEQLFWRSFSEVTEEGQQLLLSDATTITSNNVYSNKQTNRISKDKKKVLKRHIDSPFVTEIEHQVASLISVMQVSDMLVKNSTTEINATTFTGKIIYDNSAFPTLHILSLSDPLQRIIVHAISQFYCLKSLSVEEDNSNNSSSNNTCSKSIIISKYGDSFVPNLPALSLSSYLEGNNGDYYNNATFPFNNNKTRKSKGKKQRPKGGYKRNKNNGKSKSKANSNYNTRKQVNFVNF